MSVSSFRRAALACLVACTRSLCVPSFAAADPELALPGPGAATGARHPLRAARGRAAAPERRQLERGADPRLGLDRLPRRRVPLPGLALRRQRRARQPGDERSAHRRQQLLAPARDLPLPDRHRHVRQQRRRPRRAACRAAGDVDRIPDHAQHDQELERRRRDDRDRRHAGDAARLALQRKRPLAGAVLPDRARHDHAGRGGRRPARRRHRACRSARRPPRAST